MKRVYEVIEDLSKTNIVSHFLLNIKKALLLLGEVTHSLHVVFTLSELLERAITERTEVYCRLPDLHPSGLLLSRRWSFLLLELFVLYTDSEYVFALARVRRRHLQAEWWFAETYTGATVRISEVSRIYNRNVSHSKTMNSRTYIRRRMSASLRVRPHNFSPSRGRRLISNELSLLDKIADFFFVICFYVCQKEVLVNATILTKLALEQRDCLDQIFQVNCEFKDPARNTSDHQ